MQIKNDCWVLRGALKNIAQRVVPVLYDLHSELSQNRKPGSSKSHERARVGAKVSDLLRKWTFLYAVCVLPVFSDVADGTILEA